MILVIDSGSTKSDWVFVESDGNWIDSYKTIGFNPFFHSSEFIETEIRKNKSLEGISQKVSEIYYYGAGCSSPYFNGIVKEALLRVFPKASISVDHDLTAAAYATYTGSPGIACILGTGSNSCLFDGNSIYEEVPALGYILGDEGSGSYFGKKLLTSFLYKQLPQPISDDLIREFNLTKAEIFNKVYQTPHANVYLASFTRFIAKYKADPFIKEMLHQGMKDFLRVHVCGFKNFENIKAHFVGSIAFYFDESLHSAAQELGVNMGSIIKSPIQNLLQYHIKYVFNKEGNKSLHF